LPVCWYVFRELKIFKKDIHFKLVFYSLMFALLKATQLLLYITSANGGLVHNIRLAYALV